MDVPHVLSHVARQGRSVIAVSASERSFEAIDRIVFNAAIFAGSVDAPHVIIQPGFRTEH